jgi:uncharacterized protein (TIGR03435 family)
VASVKPNKSGEPFTRLVIQPGGRYNATNVPLRTIIRSAYQLQDSQLIGGPEWIAFDRFDIVARAEGEIPPSLVGGPGALQFMLRALLAERFNLKVHTERRELSIYALVQARNDGKLGAHLRPAPVDCAAVVAAGRTPSAASSEPGQRIPCNMQIGPGRLIGSSMPVSQLATILSQSVQRVVVDHTGLTGGFDFDLSWMPDQVPQGPLQAGGPSLLPSDANDAGGPSILAALQEQLGLKLEATRAPVEVLVIDRVEHPTPD